jgi:hypothetical protein
LLSIQLYKNGKETVTVTNFEECAAAGNPVMESYPRQCRDPVSGRTFTEIIEPGEKEGLSPEECLEKGGRTLNIVAGDTCEENEKSIGNVIGFISPNICCVPENIYVCTDESREGDFCITVYEPVCGYPLELTFSNSCFACLNDQIKYYIEGEC